MKNKLLTISIELLLLCLTIIYCPATQNPSINSAEYTKEFFINGDIKREIRQLIINNNFSLKLSAENGFLLDSVLNQEIYNENWRNKNKTWFDYDIEGRMISRSSLPLSYGDLGILHKDTFLYNEMDYIIEWSHKYFHKDINNGKWLNTEKRIIIYDKINRATDTLTQKWNDSLNLWENYEKRTLEFDNNGNLIVITWFSWTKNQWEYLVRTVYNYENNLLVEELYEEWHGYYWYSKFKEVYKYDNNNNNVQIDSYKMIDNEWNWEHHRDQYFDKFNNLIKVEANAIESDSILKMSLIIEYNYNENGEKNEDIYYTIVGKKPEPSDKFIYVYDNYSNLFISDHYVWNNDVWISDYRAIYYYSPFTDVEFKSINNNKLLLYPNPVVDGFVIDIPKGFTHYLITIYNYIGEIVYNNKFENNEQLYKNDLFIDLKKYPFGLYFVHLQMDNKNILIKVIKLKN